MKIFKRFKKKEETFDQDYKCRNCGTEFYGRFCPHCSQSIKEFEQPIGFMLVDFVGNMFAFDTRFWKTFKAVLYKPGHMANSFVEGHRVRYMPPFRFYIFISFVFFLLLNTSVNKSFEDESFFSDNNNNKTVLGDSLLVSKADSLFEDNIKKINVDPIVKSEFSKVEKLKNKSKFDLNYVEDNDDILSKDKLKGIYSDFKAHPDYFTTRALKYVSWSLFLFMPFFAFLMWLFFRRAYKFYVIHLVFAINQHAFLFIVFSLLIIIKTYLPDLIGSQAAYLMLALPVYHIIGAKQLYKQRTSRTIFKLLAAGFLYWFTFLTGITILILWSVLS